MDQPERDARRAHARPAGFVVPEQDRHYDQAGLCSGGSFPSGHTTTAYEAAITLATLLPDLAPEILARGSEAGNDRIVLGVHYPLDIVGGRVSGEAALAARLSDSAFVAGAVAPAQKELVDYLQTACGGTIAACYAQGKPYSSNPYGGKAIPGGTSQIVTDRASTVSVYTERLTYGFGSDQQKAAGTSLAPTADGAVSIRTASLVRHTAQVRSMGIAAANVPAGASNLLASVFPTLTDAQRTAVLAQTASTTNPLGSAWAALNLAAATSATVQLDTAGNATVTATGGTARVIPAATGSTSSPAPTASATPAATLPDTGEHGTSNVIAIAAVSAAAVGAVLVFAMRRSVRRAHRR